MVDGRFKCMGSVQHLKTKFGDGYTLTVKIRETTTTTTSTSTGAAKNKYVALILAELRHRISRSCQLKERHFNNVYQYELPYPSPSEPENGGAAAAATAGGERFRIGDVYRLVESNKIRFSIVDYSLSQNTLDNVFINFVKSTVTKAGAPASANLPSDEDDNDNENSEDDDDDQDADAEISSVGDNNDNEPSLSTTTKTTILTSTTKKKTTRKSPRYEFPLHDSDDLLLDLDDSCNELGNSRSNNSFVSDPYKM